MSDLADADRRDVDDKTRDAADQQLTRERHWPGPRRRVRGDVQITADWSGAADLDVALIDPQNSA